MTPVRTASILAAAIVFVLASGTTPALASHISCGDVVTTDTVLDADLRCTTESGLIVGADDITIDLNGHTIEAGGEFPQVVGAVRNSNHNRVAVKNGIVRGFDRAVQIAGDDCVVAGITFRANNTAVDLVEAERTRVAGNEIHANANGVLVENPNHPEEGSNVITGNVFTGGTNYSAGVVAFLTSQNSVEDNSMTAMTLGVQLSDETRANRVAGNDISIEGRRSNNFGVQLYGDGERNEVVANTIVGARFGIVVDQFGTGYRITGNTVSEATFGIDWETAATRDNRVDGNTVDGSLTTGILIAFAGRFPDGEATQVLRNRVVNSGGDGMLVNENAAAVMLEGNVVGGNADDGIDVRTVKALIRANAASANFDWGMISISPTTDGGGNRAWSNGQPDQCLNVSCGPGPPASLSLSPESATNTVGEQHCLNATVVDPDGRPNPDVIVRFTVTGAPAGNEASAAQTTDASGSARFCYEGPPYGPSVDRIEAYADADGDGTPDRDEPQNVAEKRWVLPSTSDGCKAAGSGGITAANGDAARFRIYARAKRGAVAGRQEYRDSGPAERLTVVSRAVAALTCDGFSASLFGDASVNGERLLYRVDVGDVPGGRDTYRIRLSSGYDSAEQPLASGNVNVR